MQVNENKINTVVETALKNLNSLIDINTIVGKPIKTEENDYIIPISKTSLCVISGGGEYGKKGLFCGNINLPFSAGNGSVVSIKPIGFLIKENKSGSYKMIYTEESKYEKILEKGAELLREIKEDKGDYND